MRIQIIPVVKSVNLILIHKLLLVSYVPHCSPLVQWGKFFYLQVPSFAPKHVRCKVKGIETPPRKSSPTGIFYPCFFPPHSASCGLIGLHSYETSKGGAALSSLVRPFRSSSICPVRRKDDGSFWRAPPQCMRMRWQATCVI